MKHLHTLTHSLPSALILGLMTLFVAASCGLSLIWLRNKITYTATQTQRLERHLSDLQRRQQSLVSAVAQMHRPQSLERIARAELRPMKVGQAVWVEGAPNSQRVQLAKSETSAAPIVSFTIAKNA